MNIALAVIGGVLVALGSYPVDGWHFATIWLGIFLIVMNSHLVGTTEC